MLREFKTLLRRGDNADYDINRALNNYIEDLYAIFLAFLKGEMTLEKAKKAAQDEAAAAFVVAFYAGFGAAGSGRPSQRDRAWIVKRYAKELVYLDGLFENLGKKKGLSLEELAYISLALLHATGYAKTILGLYNEGKLRGNGEVLLVLDGPDGRESCVTCQSLKGKAYPARWWVENELIPGPGTGYNYECTGINCDHRLFDLTGVQYIL